MPTAYLLSSDDGNAAHAILGEATIGRDHAADLVLSDRTVSRRHAAVRHDGLTVVVSDLGSSNGTYVDGEPVAEAARVGSGGVIRLGAAELEVRIERGERGGATPTEILPAAD